VESVARNCSRSKATLFGDEPSSIQTKSAAQVSR
jgi:hypothetical protein